MQELDQSTVTAKLGDWQAVQGRAAPANRAVRPSASEFFSLSSFSPSCSPSLRLLTSMLMLHFRLRAVVSSCGRPHYVSDLEIVAGYSRSLPRSKFAVDVQPGRDAGNAEGNAMQGVVATSMDSLLSAHLRLVCSFTPKSLSTMDVVASEGSCPTQHGASQRRPDHPIDDVIDARRRS